VISFDREQLQMEEVDLLQMASTPTPLEYDPKNGAGSIDLVARLPLGEAGSSVQAVLDERGVLRTRHTTEYPNAWWALTATSTISYESPRFTITSVWTNQPNLCTTSLTLDVGRDGHLWWEQTSRIVHQLKEAQEFKDQLQILWPRDVCQAALAKARQEVCFESTTLN
jgi:hypothetical protein